MKRVCPNIPSPDCKQVKKYIDKFKSYENYIAHEHALIQLFENYPKNDDLSEVLIKATAINGLFSTNIFSIYTVAKHIFDQQIDSRLSKNEEEVISAIAIVTMDNGNKKEFVSFATKYCSFHNPDEYPIFDKYVARILIHFNSNDSFCNRRLTKDNLRDFPLFKSTLTSFKDFYKLNEFSTKEIDKYLWLLGKIFYPRTS